MQAGGSPAYAPTMAGIALAESGGRTDALNDNPSTGDYSVGPWQINYYGSLLQPRTRRYGSPDALRSNPLLDAKAAVDLASGGAGLDNWSTYKSGEYIKYESQYDPNAALRDSLRQHKIGSGTNVIGKTADSIVTGAQNAVGSIFDAITDPIERAILRGAFILGGVFFVLVGLFLLARAFGAPTPRLPVVAAAAGYVEGRRASSGRATPRRKGDAEIERGGEVTRTGPPEHTTNVERRRASVLKSNRERAQRKEARARDKEYGDIPF